MLSLNHFGLFGLSHFPGPLNGQSLRGNNLLIGLVFLQSLKFTLDHLQSVLRICRIKCSLDWPQEIRVILADGFQLVQGLKRLGIIAIPLAIFPDRIMTSTGQREAWPGQG